MRAICMVIMQVFVGVLKRDQQGWEIVKKVKIISHEASNLSYVLLR